MSHFRPLQLEVGRLTWEGGGYVAVRHKPGRKGAVPTSTKGDGGVPESDIEPAKRSLLREIAILSGDEFSDLVVARNLSREGSGFPSVEQVCLVKFLLQASGNFFPTADDLDRHIAILNDTGLHPNIVETERIIFDDERNKVATIMHGVDGCLMQDGTQVDCDDEVVPRLRASVVLVIARDILHALSHLAEKGIVHGNVRPKNIFYEKHDGPEEKWTYKLTGFECAVKPNDNGEVAALPAMCSVAFASPELHERNDAYSFAGDIWSLGVTLHVLLYERFPFPPWTAEVHLHRSIREGKLELNALLTKDPVEATLKGIIVEMLKFEPGERGNATDLMKKLECAPVLAPAL
jgi:serine/threonine protein kinase